jgi:hypothetical protein
VSEFQLPHDIAGAWLPLGLNPFWLLMLLLFFGVVLLILIVLLWRYTIPKIKALKSALPPKSLSEEELLDVDVAQLPKSLQDVAQCSELLTRCLKRSVGLTKNAVFLDLTTDEFLQRCVAELSLLDTEKRAIREILEAADQVKYAGANPNNLDQMVRDTLVLCERIRGKAR